MKAGTNVLEFYPFITMYRICDDILKTPFASLEERSDKNLMYFLNASFDVNKSDYFVTIFCVSFFCKVFLEILTVKKNKVLTGDFVIKFR